MRNLFDLAADDWGMTNEDWNDRDIDALLAGKTPADKGLAALAPVVASLKATAANRGVAASEAQIFGAQLASTAAAPASAPAATSAARSPWVRRVSLAGIGALVLGAGVAGAAAADESAPGDPLYGLDRALEHAGIGNGGFPERVDEAQKLADEGETDEAVEHLAESLKSEGDSSSAQSLLDAAAQIRTNGSAQSADVHTAVADMLEWMATTELTGKDFGQGVAEHAHLIGAGHGKNAPATTDGTTTDAPGKSGDVHGKPENPGKPDSVTTGTANANPGLSNKPTPTPTGTPDTTPVVKP